MYSIVAPDFVSFRVQFRHLAFSLKHHARISDQLEFCILFPFRFLPLYHGPEGGGQGQISAHDDISFPQKTKVGPTELNRPLPWLSIINVVTINELYSMKHYNLIDTLVIINLICNQNRNKIQALCSTHRSSKHKECHN